MGKMLTAVALATAALLGLLLNSPAHVQSQSAGCGSDRWNVKTLSDPSVGDIDLSRSIGVNISTLVAAPVPDSLPPDARFDPYETTIYTTSADLVEARLQPDGDIVLVIEDPNSGTTMTAAFPDVTNCAQGADPSLAAFMQKARSAFVQAFGMPVAGSPLALSGVAQVTGVGFIDPVLGQDGEAASGLEFHPILDFETAGGGAATTP
jgi:hypothetical protein